MKSFHQMLNSIEKDKYPYGFMHGNIFDQNLELNTIGLTNLPLYFLPLEL